MVVKSTKNCLFIYEKQQKFQDSSLLSYYTIRKKFDKLFKKVNRKVQEEPQAEVAANPWHQEEEKK